MEVSARVSEFKDKLKEYRRALHRLAELSNAEFETQKYIVGALSRAGLKPRLIRTGVTADIAGEDRTRRVALRADTDALRIQEENEVDYKSATPGVMHACGHDGHAAILLCAAELFTKYKPARDVRLIFQPAEEGGGGASMMIENGVLDGVDEIYALHIDPSLPAGTFAAGAGVVLAGTVEFDIEFYAESAHCAERAAAKNALLAAALYVSESERLAERHSRTLLHTGRLEGGSARNIVANRALAFSTARFYDDAERDKLMLDVERLLIDVTNRTGAEHRLTVEMVYPPLYNHPQSVAAAARRVPLSPAAARFTAEDFSEYLLRVPGCFVWLGVRTGGPIKKLHTGDFDFDERALLWGLEFYDRMVNITDN